MSRLLVAFLCLACGVRAFSQEKPEQAAQKAALQWLALVDSGNYGASWQDAAGLFKHGVPEKKWEAMITSVRQQTGKLKSRKLKNATYTESLPGAPPGKYVVIHYESSFDSGSYIETVTPLKEKDGDWKVSGYFVSRSD